MEPLQFKTTILGAQVELISQIWQDLVGKNDHSSPSLWHQDKIADGLIRETEIKYKCSIISLSGPLIAAINDPSIPKVAVFDLDSTLIQMEVIDELAKAKPEIAAQVAKITEESMAGRLDFKQALAKRVSLLEGLVIEPLWQKIKDEVRFTTGVFDLFQKLLNPQNGWTCAIVSGGFLPIAEWVRQKLGMQYAFANALEVDESGKLTGKLLAGHDIVDGEAKRAHLLQLSNHVGAGVKMAVGDGANDLLMLRVADIGVAFNAKPIVQERAQYRLNNPDFSLLICALSK